MSVHHCKSLLSFYDGVYYINLPTHRFLTALSLSTVCMYAIIDACAVSSRMILPNDEQQCEPFQ